MEEFAYAIRLAPDEYEYFLFKDIESLYQATKEKGVFPVRKSFDVYLKQASLSPEGVVFLEAPDSEDDPFEVVLGTGRAVIQNLLEVHLHHVQIGAQKEKSLLEEKLAKILKENSFARQLLNQLAEGKIPVEKLKGFLAKLPPIPGADS